MKNTRKKLFNFIKGLTYFRNIWINTGFGVFCGLGFIYSVFALAFIFSDRGITSPILLYSMKAFGIWISFAMVMITLGYILSAIYSNKKNWEKKDGVKKETFF